MSKKAKIPFWEKAMWWCSVIGSVIVVLVAIPAMPWRYSRVDTNCGNRFVMERYYFLTGMTNNLGKTEGWMSVRRKLQRKVEEFGRPSPLVAIAGVASQSLGAGGAAMGCSFWLVCKEHVNTRFMQYTSIAYASFACIGACLVQAGLSAGFCVYLGFKQKGSSKKKKKKKDDECMDMDGKIMAFAVFAFLFATGAVAGFVILTGNMFKMFAETAYYPFAMAHAAPFAGSLGCFLLFITACVTTNRVFMCCGGKKEEEGEWGGGEWGGGEYGGYGGKGW